MGGWERWPRKKLEGIAELARELAKRDRQIATLIAGNERPRGNCRRGAAPFEASGLPVRSGAAEGESEAAGKEAGAAIRKAFLGYVRGRYDLYSGINTVSYTHPRAAHCLRRVLSATLPHFGGTQMLSAIAADDQAVYSLSGYVRTIADPEAGSAFVYHSLYGRPLILNAAAMEVLQLFAEPRSAAAVASVCDGDPSALLSVFAEHAFIVPRGWDERAPVRARKAEHLQAVAAEATVDRMGLAISDLCNFGCGHCIHFQPSTNGGAVLPLYQGNAAQLNMSAETARRCIDQYTALITRQGQTTGKIHFGNAEPLTNWPVIEAVLAYCDALTPLAFEFSINTNLSLLTREMALVLKCYRVAIATSLDGNAQANDAIRVTRGGQGTYAAIVAKFDLLAEIGYPLDGFSITVTRDNFDLVDTDILAMAAERSMTSIAFDYDLVSLAHVPVPLRVEKLLRMKRFANAHGMDFFGTWDAPFRNITSASLLDGTHAFCAAVQGKSLQFNVDGSVKVCGHTTTRVSDARHLQKAFTPGGGLYELVAARFPGTDAYCGDCEIEGPCGGQCHVTREVVARASDLERERLFADMCDFYRATTQALALEYMRSDGQAATVNPTGGCSGG